jgi:hypothetical protein
MPMALTQLGSGAPGFAGGVPLLLPLQAMSSKAAAVTQAVVNLRIMMAPVGSTQLQ